MANENAQSTQNIQRVPTARERMKQRKDSQKAAIDANFNAQVFISDSLVGEELFRQTRTFDAVDSAMRKLWGGAINADDMKQWVDFSNKLKETFNEAIKFGKLALCKTNGNGIQNRFLRNQIKDMAKAQKAQKSKSTTAVKDEKSVEVKAGAKTTKVSAS